MATQTKRPSGHSGEFVELTFDSFRNITSPADKELDRKLFTGQLPISEVVVLSTDDNVRDYLVDAENKQRRRRSQVHVAIADTLRNNPRDFGILNGGVTIVARGYEVDEQRKIMRLILPSIINGSQTQGVIREYLGMKSIEKPKDPIFVKFELIVSGDENLIAETSISRNYQNDVQPLSIVGRRGHLNDLEKAVQRRLGEVELRKSETEAGLPTEKIIQVITALMPEELWVKRKPKEKDPNKVYTYAMKAKCLKEFDDIYKDAHESGENKDPLFVERAKEVYQYYLDVAADAWLLYQKWKQHPGFEGSGIRNAVERGEDGRTIIDVADGMVFPILAAYSAFVVKTPTGWEIRPPAAFDDKDLIAAAIQAYQRIAGSNPWNMGKDPGCYAMCQGVTTLYRKLIG
jgi:AIPR protein